MNSLLIKCITGLTSLAVLFSCTQKTIIPETGGTDGTQAQSKTVTALSITPDKITLKVGQTTQLTAKITPTDAECATLNWKSLGGYAKVDNNGLVTAMQEGIVLIRVYTPDQKVYAHCTVTVEKATEPGPGPLPTTYRTWEDTGADLPDYPTYTKVSSVSDFPRIDITWTTPSLRISDGEYTWVEGTVRFRDPKGMYCDEQDSGVLQMRLRGRGNTTWNAEGGIKRPYKIKLSEHRKVFGMKGDKDWILLADVQDPTMLRNAVALRIARMVSMPWTPKFRTAEVYFNGTYGGCYLLTEAKETDRENKVPITVVQPGQTEGGYYLEIDNKIDGDRSFRTETFNKKIKFKDPEDPDDAQYEYITGIVNEVERLLKERSFDPETGYQSLTDLYTFIGNYIVQELTMNVDGGMRLSTYFAKDKDTKLFMPMVWDFDLSLGNCSYLQHDFALPVDQAGPEGWLIKIRGGSFEFGDRDGSAKSYYQYMFEDEHFVAALKERWKLVKPRLDKIPAYIDQMVEYNKLAYDHNVSGGKNPRAKKSKNDPPESFTSWSEAVAYMKDFYTKRLAWLDTAINEEL